MEVYHVPPPTPLCNAHQKASKLRYCEVVTCAVLDFVEQDGELTKGLYIVAEGHLTVANPAIEHERVRDREPRPMVHVFPRKRSAIALGGLPLYV